MFCLVTNLYPIVYAGSIMTILSCLSCAVLHMDCHFCMNSCTCVAVMCGIDLPDSISM